ncbi:MAG: hypothetical protein DDT34_02133 [Firmicutes bacterium]|nr:hypothetical protein [Bacillota bacterium]MBT9158183.1 hypothetical protein [Bacillota bacterium]
MSQFSVHTATDQKFCAIANELQGPHRILIADKCHKVGRQNIMDESAHFVAYALDAVLAPSTRSQGRALVRLESHNLRFGETMFNMIPGGDCARRTRGGCEAGDAPIADAPNCLDRGATRHITMKAVVGH